MADSYENIRKALAMLGPGNSTQEQIAALDDLDHACDPDTLRALLAERDALLADKARMDWLEHATRSCTTYADGSRAFNFTSLDLRHLRGPTLRAAVDAAIAVAKENSNDRQIPHASD